jgi:hypothetical protein
VTGGYRNAPPRASALLEALRGLGYSTATALADLIDNSISARSTHVEISFNWRGRDSVITVIDDGHGMSEEQLDRAMRLGESSPLESRDIDDLGRFGLGLKTASFSQCRRLTVASRREGSAACLCWDLDVLASANDGEWRLLEGPPESAQQLVTHAMSHEDGTLVVWECLDRIVTLGFTEQDFLDLIDRVERHLAMVFHRFIDGSTGNFSITINGRSIRGWDPFLLSHPSTWRSPVERVPSDAGLVGVQCFVLPHKDRLDARAFDDAAGPDGWTAQQGFYVYRNQRMLVAGSWLGLGPGRSWTKEESHRLARIRLDIPNAADASWKIDIRKSTARPPVEIRDRLARLAEDARARARRVFAHRGQPAAMRGAPVQLAWTAERSAVGFRYRIDDTHPAVRMVLEEAGTLLPAVKSMLRVIEETVPVQRIWLDTAESKDPPRTGFAMSSPEEVETVLMTVYRNLVIRKGLSAQLARGHLLVTEPFNQYPELVSALPDDLIHSE